MKTWWNNSLSSWPPDPVKQCWNKIASVWNKEDPGTWAYAVMPGHRNSNHNFNLKTIINQKVGRISQDESVTVTYDKEARTVRFTSSYFDLYQTGLPEDVDFCLAVTLE